MLRSIFNWRLRTPFYYGWLVLGITALATFAAVVERDLNKTVIDIPGSGAAGGAAAGGAVAAASALAFAGARMTLCMFVRRCFHGLSPIGIPRVSWGCQMGICQPLGQSIPIHECLILIVCTDNRLMPELTRDLVATESISFACAEDR